jgi:hypothetical protein
MIAKFAHPVREIVREISAIMFRASSACWHGRFGRREGILPVRAMPVQSGPFILSGSKRVVWKERVRVGRGTPALVSAGTSDI